MMKRIPSAALFTCIFLNAVFGIPRATALNPSLDITQYSHVAWTFRNGFINGAVYAITQAPDGYFWLGTQSGVVRFDGVRAVPLPLAAGQQLPSSAVGAVLSARDGTLWIGTLDGLASWKDGQLTEYPALAHQTVVVLLEGRDGTLWAGGFGSPTGKLCAIRRGEATCYGDDGRLGILVSSLYEDPNGSLWVGAATGLWQWNPGPPTRRQAIPIVSLHAFTPGEQGASIIVAADNVYESAGEKFAKYPLEGTPSPLTARSVLRDRHGGLWIGTQTHGLVHSYRGKTFQFSQADGLTGDAIVAIFEDREGTIWVATPNGLDQFRESPVGSLSLNQGLSSAITTSILAARDGSIWIGTANGLNRWKDGHLTVYQSANTPGLPGDAIQSLFEDETGRIWVSGFAGLAVFDQGAFTKVPAVPPGFVNAMETDRHGGLWLSMWLTADDRGLVHLAGDKLIENIPWRQFGGGPGTGLLTDSDGGIWTGLLSGGLSYLHAGQIRPLPLNDERGRPRRVLDVGRDRDGSMWAATENGLSRIKDGRVETLTAANGLPCSAVHWIIDDNLGSYWLYTRCGLVRLARSEMESWIKDPSRSIRSTIFDAGDGIRPVATTKGFRPAVSKAPDGKIWFLNGDTVSIIDPSRVVVNTLPPPVHIEQVTANHASYNPTSGLRLPALVRDLTIDYTALSLVAPDKVRFRYQLEGQDPTWREVVNDRQVQYSNLSPGHYRFRVTASNNSGVWNETGDTLDFSIAPAFWQAAWFRALCVAASVAFLWVLFRLRMRQLAHEFDMKMEAGVEERTRLARELHDTLLQSFNGLLLRFRAVHTLLDKDPQQARAMLESTIGETRAALTEGRRAVQGLRASRVESQDFDEAIKTLTEELANDTHQAESVDVRMNVEGSPRNLRPLIRDEIYRIASEALRNAFHHAKARRIEVQLHYDGESFELRVRDDGRGIDPQFLNDEGPEGHFGLRGMRERAQHIGGRLTIWSAPGSGAELVLNVPGEVAYDNHARSRPSWQGAFTGRPNKPPA